MELKTTLFQAARLELLAYRSTGGHDALTAFDAYKAVMEQVGIFSEFEEWMDN